jgi:hypothetical protein
MYSLKKNYEKIYLSVSYDFSKFDGSRKIKVFPSGPPNDTFAQQKIKTWCHARNNNRTSK